MNVIDKVVIKNGVDADTVKTINLNTGQVDEINAILATISSTRGIAAYSVATGNARQIIVKAEFQGADTEPTHTIDIKVASINELEIYTISNLYEYNCNPLSIITSGGTFYDGTTSKVLHPNKGAAIGNNEFKLVIRIIKVGTVIYIV